MLLQNVDIVIHAAALKQVPASEYNPFEFVKTNIIGAQNVVDMRLQNNVGNVVVSSTDKASSPPIYMVQQNYVQTKFLHLPKI